jgi:DNA-binding GntR family transcriptional regulator
VATSESLSRSLLADQVKDRLLERIVSGEYPPHSRIVETQVARELNTSQAPVREALRALEALGVVEIMPFKGARVRRPARLEILEAYAVRLALETLAIRLAAPHLTKQDLVQLAEQCDLMHLRAREGDMHAVAEADAGFHGRILEVAGNRTLRTVWASLEPFLRTYITLVVPGADPEWAANLHTPILEALQQEDTEAAVQAITQHFEAASANLAARWEEESGARATRPEAAETVDDEPSQPLTDRAAPVYHR